MYHSAIFTFCLLASQIHGLNAQARIVGGTTANIRNHPYQVSIMTSGSHACGGALVDADTVVTAAHCVIGADLATLSVRAGSSFRTSGGTVVDARRVQIHPRFNRRTFNYDLALIHLMENLPIGPTIQPIQIYTRQLYGGWLVTATGWGTLGEGRPLSNVLRKVSFRIQNRRQCRRIYQTQLVSSLFCAGDLTGNRDTCQGDSGGPLVSNNFLVGIISTGNGCARRGFPGLNTKIPLNSAWILNNLNN